MSHLELGRGSEYRKVGGSLYFCAISLVLNTRLGRKYNENISEL